MMQKPFAVKAKPPAVLYSNDLRHKDFSKTHYNSLPPHRNNHVGKAIANLKRINSIVAEDYIELSSNYTSYCSSCSSCENFANDTAVEDDHRSSSSSETANNSLNKQLKQAQIIDGDSSLLNSRSFDIFVLLSNNRTKTSLNSACYTNITHSILTLPKNVVKVPSTFSSQQKFNLLFKNLDSIIRVGSSNILTLYGDTYSDMTTTLWGSNDIPGVFQRLMEQIFSIIHTDSTFKAKIPPFEYRYIITAQSLAFSDNTSIEDVGRRICLNDVKMPKDVTSVSMTTVPPDSVVDKVRERLTDNIKTEFLISEGFDNALENLYKEELTNYNVSKGLHNSSINTKNTFDFETIGDYNVFYLRDFSQSLLFGSSVLKERREDLRNFNRHNAHLTKGSLEVFSTCYMTELNITRQVCMLSNVRSHFNKDTLMQQKLKSYIPIKQTTSKIILIEVPDSKILFKQKHYDYYPNAYVLFSLSYMFARNFFHKNISELLCFCENSPLTNHLYKTLQDGVQVNRLLSSQCSWKSIFLVNPNFSSESLIKSINTFAHEVQNTKQQDYDVTVHIEPENKLFRIYELVSSNCINEEKSKYDRLISRVIIPLRLESKLYKESFKRTISSFYKPSLTLSKLNGASNSEFNYIFKHLSVANPVPDIYLIDVNSDLTSKSFMDNYKSIHKQLSEENSLVKNGHLDGVNDIDDRFNLNNSNVLSGHDADAVDSAMLSNELQQMREKNRDYIEIVDAPAQEYSNLINTISLPPDKLKDYYDFEKEAYYKYTGYQAFGSNQIFLDPTIPEFPERTAKCSELLAHGDDSDVVKVMLQGTHNAANSYYAGNNNYGNAPLTDYPVNVSNSHMRHSYLDDCYYNENEKPNRLTENEKKRLYDLYNRLNSCEDVGDINLRSNNYRKVRNPHQQGSNSCYRVNDNCNYGSNEMGSRQPKNCTGKQADDALTMASHAKLNSEVSQLLNDLDEAPNIKPRALIKPTTSVTTELNKDSADATAAKPTIKSDNAKLTPQQVIVEIPLKDLLLKKLNDTEKSNGLDLVDGSATASKKKLSLFTKFKNLFFYCSTDPVIRDPSRLSVWQPTNIPEAKSSAADESKGDTVDLKNGDSTDSGKSDDQASSNTTSCESVDDFRWAELAIDYDAVKTKCKLPNCAACLKNKQRAIIVPPEQIQKYLRYLKTAGLFTKATPRTRYQRKVLFARNQVC